MKAFVAVGILFLVFPINAMKWSGCADGPFVISRVTLQPDPPKVGENIDFGIEGDYAPKGTKL
jgi:hypothetical protein